MKCLKNLKTGNIVRVDDKQAYNMVGTTWNYISKSEWKAATRKPKPEVVEAAEETTASEKQLKRKKNVKDRSK
jgi:hypothetical protein